MKENSKTHQSRPHRPDFNELTQRISFVDVLGHYHLLEQMNRKGDQLRGICPIHQGAENKNSLSVNTVRNCFKCFSCGSQGNILDFVAAMESCSKYKAGCLLEEWFPAPASGGDTGVREKRVQEKKRGLDGGKQGVASSNEGTGKDSPVQQKSPHGEVNPPLTFILKNLDVKHPYLLERVRVETIERFSLGVCGKGLMNGRVVVPVHNENGELVAYVGRWPGDDFPKGEGKYKVPPAFKKGYVLFNLHRVIEAVRKDEPLILVEGFFDVFRLYELGYPNAVALMGSSLTKEQEDLLKSVLTPLSRVALMFDNDSAGTTCAGDVAARLSAWCFIRVVNLPEGITQPDQLQKGIEIF